MERFYQKLQDQMLMIKAFNKETDRSAVLLSTSFIDAVLEEVLRNFLVDDDVTNKLFEGYAPLSTFSAKIDMAFSLGLITREMRHDLGVIRKIRNRFAHEWKDLQLDKPPISDLCANIITLKTLLYKRDSNGQLVMLIGTNSNEIEVIKGNDSTFFTRKEQFIMTVNVLCASIYAITERESQRKPPKFDYLATEL